MLTAREMAVGIISGHKMRMLEEAGLTVVYQEKKNLPRYTRYPVGYKRIIGKVVLLDDGEIYPVVSIDPGQEGYELVYASSHEWMYAEWVGIRNCKDFEVI